MRYKIGLLVIGVALGGIAAARALPSDFTWGEPEVWERDADIAATISPLSPEVSVGLTAEREALAARAALLDEHEARIRLAADALTVQISHLDELRTELNDILGLAEARHEVDTERLVRIYQAMKPAQAGSILNDMDIEVATLVLSAMPEKDAGPIMANMRPIRVQAISKIIFERSKLPGDQKLFSVRLD